MLEQNLSTLKIHKLTQSQYNRELEIGNIDETALYLTPEEELDLTDYVTKDELQSSIQSIFNLVYPIGSIYISIVSTNPSILFGGTWERIEDKFLLASGAQYMAGSVGGEAISVSNKTTYSDGNQLPPYLAVYVFKRTN